ncbi:MAG: thioesterase [Sphaerochaetaceae bacterium]|nr:thioesterase [Sphaerochaetaceae bacterium]MDC7238480.1 thioesterase [Sphaerochaetaceae bacterium]MDC7248337.1 thioesterase [Sphaerochaetaceae bacterium]
MKTNTDSLGLNKNNIFREVYLPYTYNCDSHLFAKLDWCFEVVQEIAGYHSSLLKCSIYDLNSQNLTWVISRENIEIFKYPKWREKVFVETWAELPFRRVLVPRIIEGKNERGELLFRSTTLWAIIDLKTNKPIEPLHILEKIGVPKEAYNRKFYIKKREFFNEENPIIGTSSPIINYSDTDFNKHVNNISYIRWVLQSLPNKFRDEYVVKNIDVSWLKQTFIQDKVKMVTNSLTSSALKEENPIFQHKLVREEKDGSQKIVFEAKSFWIKRS